MLFVCPLIILLAGDIHTNPGPDGGFHDISLCHSNIRSLSQDKMRSIQCNIAPNFDIITLSETFLSNSTSDSDLLLPGFHGVIRRDRPHALGGGVALFVSRALVVSRRPDLELPDIELLWCEIRYHNNKFQSGRGKGY